MTPPGDYFWLLGLAAFLVGLSKGGLPAIAMLAVPTLSLVMSPVKAATLLLPIYILTDMVGITLYRRVHSRVNLRILIPAGVMGVGVGWATASLFSDAALALLIGLIGIGFCLNAWFGPGRGREARPAHVGRGLFWGTLAGFTSFISHAGGPPYQVYMLPQRLPKLEFAGTTVIVFATINAAKIIPYQTLRPYGLEDLVTAAWLIPFALAGTGAGAVATRWISEKWFYRLVQVGLFAISVKLIAGVVF
ncbi:MAG: sulfite exporter TauE/SafE family protein [Rhodobacterales bacterium]|nr:sulfite exporter TauE/SafE family protein [Rhodobacterales bacterium]